MNENIIEIVVTQDGYALRLGHSLNDIYSERLPGKNATYHQSSGGWGKEITRFEEDSSGVKVFSGEALVGKLFSYRALIYKC